MDRTGARSTCAVLVLGLCACASSRNVRARVGAATHEFEARVARGDLAGVARMYEDDAVIMGPSGIAAEGREAIDAYWKGSEGVERLTMDVESVEGGREMPVQMGRSVVVTGAGGARRMTGERFVTVWRRQRDGSYRIAVDASWPDQ